MSKDSSYDGLILAAGLSSRMGDFKPLLPFNGKTLIESTIDSMLEAGLKQIVIVLGHRGDEVSAALRSRYGKEIILTKNPRYKTTDMLESMKWGLRAMPHCKAFFLLPGDMPVVKKSTFLKLMMASPSDRPAIILPTLEGREKHPPLIDSRFHEAIMELKGNGGLRKLWTQQADSIIRIPVDDEGVRIDLDTREDYEVCISRFCRPEYKSKEEIKIGKDQSVSRKKRP